MTHPTARNPGHEDCPTCPTCGLTDCPDCHPDGRAFPIVHDLED